MTINITETLGGNQQLKAKRFSGDWENDRVLARTCTIDRDTLKFGQHFLEEADVRRLVEHLQQWLERRSFKLPKKTRKKKSAQ